MAERRPPHKERLRWRTEPFVTARSLIYLPKEGLHLFASTRHSSSKVMQSLATSASEAAEQSFLPTITAGPDRRAQVTAPGSNPYRTYALGGMGYLPAAMAWRLVKVTA